MTKRDLVILVADKLGMKQSNVSRIIEGTLETITKSRCASGGTFPFPTWAASCPCRANRLMPD